MYSIAYIPGLSRTNYKIALEGVVDALQKSDTEIKLGHVCEVYSAD